MKSVALVGLLGLVSGCESISEAFRERETVDSSVVATWWDGPRVRPGVQLTIQIGTVAAPPTPEP